MKKMSAKPEPIKRRPSRKKKGDETKPIWISVRLATLGALVRGPANIPELCRRLADDGREFTVHRRSNVFRAAEELVGKKLLDNRELMHADRPQGGGRLGRVYSLTKKGTAVSRRVLTEIDTLFGYGATSVVRSPDTAADTAGIAYSTSPGDVDADPFLAEVRQLATGPEDRRIALLSLRQAFTQQRVPRSSEEIHKALEALGSCLETKQLDGYDGDFVTGCRLIVEAYEEWLMRHAFPGGWTPHELGELLSHPPDLTLDAQGRGVWLLGAFYERYRDHWILPERVLRSFQKAWTVGWSIGSHVSHNLLGPRLALRLWEARGLSNIGLNELESTIEEHLDAFLLGHVWPETIPDALEAIRRRRDGARNLMRALRGDGGFRITAKAR